MFFGDFLFCSLIGCQEGSWGEHVRGTILLSSWPRPMLCAEHLLTVLLSAAHRAGDPGEADLRERGQGEDGHLPGI